MLLTQGACKTELVTYGHQRKARNAVEMVWMRQHEHPEETGMGEDIMEMLWFLMTGLLLGYLKPVFSQVRAVG